MEAARSGARRAPLFVTAAALLLFFLRFGYDFGTSDQDEVIPYLLHRLDPALLSNDWFVLTQAGAFGIRTYFVALIEGLALVLPVWAAVLALYVAGWLLIAGAVYALGHAVTRKAPAAAAAVVAALVLTPQWTLGGNDLVHTMLVPSMWGWALGLWGLVCYLREKPWQAALLLGAATWMQALVGLQLAGLLGVLLLWRYADDPGRRSLRAVLVFAGVYLLAALPALGPLVYQQLSASPPADAAAPSLFYVMAAFRNPHHYLFFSFPVRALVRFGLLAALGGAGFVLLLRRQPVFHRTFLSRSLAVVAVLCLFGFVFTEVIPVLPVAKLQLFKTTVLAKLLFVILICGAAFAWLPARLAALLTRLVDLRRGGLVLVLAAWLFVAGSLLRGLAVMRARVGPLAREGTPTAQVETWARTQTPRDAVFAVPPSWSGFRSHAQRAVVVDFKAFPYRDDAAREWFERLAQTAPLPLPERAGPALQDSLDAAFLRQPAPALRRLADRYGVDYVVRTRPLAGTPASFERVFSAGEWIVYRVAGNGGGAR